jgi:GTP-binding nuclear protein Ran
MFGIISLARYTNIETLHRDLIGVCNNIPIALVGNKIDIRDRKVPAKRVTFHKKNNTRYFEISAKSNNHFQMSFLSLARSLVGDPNLQFTIMPSLMPLKYKSIQHSSQYLRNCYKSLTQFHCLVMNQIFWIKYFKFDI